MRFALDGLLWSYLNLVDLLRFLRRSIFSTAGSFGQQGTKTPRKTRTGNGNSVNPKVDSGKGTAKPTLYDNLNNNSRYFTTPKISFEAIFKK